MGNFLTLGELNVGEAGIVSNIISSDSKFKRRLLELGFVEGVKVRVISESILKEVILVELLNYTISLRRDLAKKILIKGRLLS